MTNQLPIMKVMTWGQASKTLFPLALPMALSQLVSITSSFLCMTMVAKLGHTILAASALIFSTQMSFLMIGMSVLFSLSVFIGHSYGAKNYILAGTYLQQSWTLGLIISVPLIFIFWHMGNILLFLGQSKELAEIVRQFFHVYVLGVIPVMIAVCNQQFCYGMHKQKIVILATCISVSVLLLTAYTLIFGKWGMPQLGVRGLAIAMAMQPITFTTFTMLCLYFGKSFKPFELFRYRVHKNFIHLTHMFKVGWPISLQIGGEMLSFFVIAAMIGWLGSDALAAYQVTSQYMFLIIVPIFAIAQASGILIGKACGSKQFHEIKTLGYASMMVGFSMSIITAILFLLFPTHLAALYFDVHNPANAHTLHLTIIIFSITAFSQLFDGVRNIVTGSLRGLFDTRFPMIIGLLAIWFVGIPLSYALGFHWQFGVIGIVVGSAFGMLTGALILLYRWYLLTKNIENKKAGMIERQGY
jgi:MATE family multidrug resistance protein